MTDPIADLLTRIRNAQQARHDSTNIPYSQLKENIIKTLSAEGFIKGYEVVGEGLKKQLVVQLRYVGRRKPVISGLRRVSKPGRRVYRHKDLLADFRPGMGVALISTPKGVMTERQATEANVGGEVLCQVW